jgi:DNA-binding NarL/FixJ family response regulator
MIRVLLAEKQTLIRAGLRHIVESRTGYRVVGEAADSTQLVSLIRTLSADVLVLDMSLPDDGLIELMRQIRREQAHLKVLALTHSSQTRVARWFFENGGSGLIGKNNSADEFCRAINKVAAGGVYLDSSSAEDLVIELSTVHPAQVYERLSHRELEVYRRLARGESGNSIARALFISAKTVSTHKARIQEKLHLGNTVELVRYALRNRLFEEGEL